MNKQVALVVAALVGAALAVVACGSAESTSVESTAYPYNDASNEGTSPGAFDAGAPQIAASGLVLVHAASFPAFRVCFEGTLQDRPIPSTEVMPESNVVGVEVGTAVRLASPSTILGRAFVFQELSLRGLYPAFGGDGVGPTCKQLLQTRGVDATEVANLSSDLASGVHALVLQGCPAGAADPTASAERCGSTWTESRGNLRLTDIALTAFQRRTATPGLPVQFLQLSPGLVRKSDGRALGLAFGALEGGVAPLPFVEGLVPFGKPVPDPPALLDYSGANVEAYATSGVFVTLGGPLGKDAGPDATREVVLSQSLEDIQRRSASRSLPPEWFAVASSYVLLSVGEPNPRLRDGGPDTDERRMLHLLAIPLAAVDGGSDAGQ